MNKKVLRERLDELVKQIKTNSKDIHFAERLIEELLLTKSQLCNEPLELDCGKKEDEYETDTYRVTLTNKGALYHEYGGYSVFATPNCKALYQTLAEIAINKEKIFDNHEDTDLAMTAIGYCISTPKIALSDIKLTFDIAETIVNYINRKYKSLMKEPLKEETVAEDEAFKNSVLATEELKKFAKE